MKVFVAGATGVVGTRLVPLLISAGHEVIASTRTPAKVRALTASGAEAVVVDALDAGAVKAAVVSAQPDVIVHQMTALAGMGSLKRFDDEFALTNRLRTEGTEYLLAAAREAGVRRFIAQSFTGWSNERIGTRVKNEDDPLDPHPPVTMSKTLDAIRTLEATVTGTTGLTGIALRYGYLYGPGTSLGIGGDIVEAVRRRRFPIVGSGAGVWSFVHVDDAAAAARVAIERGPSGVYNIVDDEPAEIALWLPELARAVGGRPPIHVPTWVGRLAIGAAGVSMMTQTRGSSNAKAKRVLGWQPRYASWRDGFRHGLGADVVARTERDRAGARASTSEGDAFARPGQRGIRTSV